MAKFLYVASVEDHISAFHLPYIDRLRRQGHEVQVAVRCKNGPRLGSDGVVWHDVSFVRFPLAFDNLRAFFKLIALLRSTRFDVVHVHTPVASFLARLAVLVVGRYSRVAYTVHGFHFFSGASLLAWLLFYPLEKIARPWTDALLVMNEEDWLQAERMGYEPRKTLFRVPGVGVDLLRYAMQKDFPIEFAALESRAISFTCIAELIPRKNLIFLLESWCQAVGDLPNAHLFIVGKGPEQSRIEEWVKEKKCPRVKLLGFRKDIPEILGATDVFLLVSKQEGLPRATLEAMAAGKPIIASRIRGHIELVMHGHNGFLVDTTDKVALIAAIQELARNESLRCKMGCKSLEIVQPYDLEHAQEAVEQVYQKLLEGRKNFA